MSISETRLDLWCTVGDMRLSKCSIIIIIIIIIVDKGILVGRTKQLEGGKTPCSCALNYNSGRREDRQKFLQCALDVR